MKPSREWLCRFEHLLRIERVCACIGAARLETRRCEVEKPPSFEDLEGSKETGEMGSGNVKVPTLGI